jgi:hypothetical protein
MSLRASFWVARWWNEPSAMHAEEILGEDDDFLSIGSETWDYDIAEGREDGFLAAFRNSGMGIECEPLDE